MLRRVLTTMSVALVSLFPDVRYLRSAKASASLKRLNASSNTSRCAFATRFS
jgi:hypothetical protein